ncbi:MAG: TRAP transporter small permease subunit [Burkholderiaceae bacterium]
MSFFLALSRLIDAVNEKIGHLVSWALLLAVLICAGNAVVRYAFNMSSNSWLEIQWYLYGAVFLLGASYTLRRNEHVRIDVVAGRLSKPAQVWIDILGFSLFLLPVTILILYDSIPYALLSIQSQEYSTNSGGLIIWPAKLLIPVSFLLLALQGGSELIKRIGYLTGHVEADAFDKHVVTPEEEIAAIKAANKID